MQKTRELPIQMSSKRSNVGAVIALASATLISSLAISSVNIALPELVVSLNTTFNHVQWIVISYMAMLTATLVIAGRLSDTFGHRKLFLVGIALFTESAGLCGITQNLWQLVLLRAFQGSGAAILIVVNMRRLSR